MKPQICCAATYFGILGKDEVAGSNLASSSKPMSFPASVFILPEGGTRMKKQTLLWISMLTLVLVLLFGFRCDLKKERAEEIPMLNLQGDLSGMTDKTDIRNVTFEYSDDSANLTGFASVKLQGNLSLQYEKKNFNIKFYHDADHSKARKIDFGWGEESKYCLKANWIDQTHARNLVTAKLSSQVQEKYGLFRQAPCNGVVDGFPIELYINGEFYGLYTFNIPKDSWMLGMDENNPNHIFFVCEKNGDPAFFRARADYSFWALEVGMENQETLDKLNRVFDFVMNATVNEFRTEFENYFDLDAALNYYVMLDFCLLNDNRAKNMALATYDGEIWYLTLYDMDTSWGARYDGMSLYPYDVEPLIFSANDLLVRIEEAFPRELALRYFELREDLLTKEHVMALFEDFRYLIPENSFEKEWEKWGPEIPGYDYAQIEDYLDTNLPYLENKYSRLLAS